VVSGPNPYQAWVWKGQGGAPALVKAPVAPSGLNHELLQVTVNGRMLWRARGFDSLGSNITGQQFVISAPDAPDRIMPDLPASPGASEFGVGIEINDLGHVLQARSAQLIDNGQTAYDNEYWFDQGQGWQRLPSPGRRVASASFDFKGLSSLDTLFVNVEAGAFLWSLRDPAVKQALPEAFYLAFSPQGVLGGASFMPQSRLAPNLTHGVVVLNGALLDLNEVTSGVPAGWVVSNVHSISGKGQIVVEMRDITKKAEESGKAIRVALLTPQ
jgi:hypothetical protein